MSTYYVAGLPYSDELWYDDSIAEINNYWVFKRLRNSNELYHHGIKGQEWGKKNGPPYPLDQENHSKNEQKSGWKNSLDKDTKELGNWSDKHHLTKKQKALIAAGVVAAAAITTAVIYDKKTGKISSAISIATTKSVQSSAKEQLGSEGYTDSELVELAETEEYKKVFEEVKDGLDNTTQATGINFIESYMEDERPGGKLLAEIQKRDLASDLGPMTKLEHTSSILETARAVNPNFNVKDAKTSNNCGLCSMAYDLRRRGYNAFAGLSDSGTSYKDIEDLYPGSKRITRFGELSRSISMPQPTMKSSDISSVIKSFSKEPGTRGTIFVSWGYVGGGHAMSYEVSPNGDFSIIDPQCGNVYSGKQLNDFLGTVSSIDSWRLDNIEPDIKQMMRRQLVI